MAYRQAGLTICAAVMAWGTAAAAPLMPRIVLQANTEIDAAAWTTRDDFILTVSSNALEVTIWDVARRVIVDRLPLPLPAEDGFLTIDAIEVAAGDKTATVTGRRFDAVLPERPQKWSIDLRARRVTPQPVEKAAGPPRRASGVPFSPWIKRSSALSRIYGESDDGNPMTVAQALAILPTLPRSHDGKWSIERTIGGMSIVSGEDRRAILTDPPLGFDSADLSPDGTKLALSVSDVATEMRVLLVDLPTGRSLSTIERTGEYGRVEWLDNRRLALFADDSADNRQYVRSPAIPAPTLVVDTVTRRDALSLPPLCYVTATPHGFIGAGLGNCRPGGADRKLWTTDAAHRWNHLSVSGEDDGAINSLAAAADGRHVAYAKYLNNLHSVEIVDPQGKPINTIALPNEATLLSFAEDGKSLLIGTTGNLYRQRLDVRLSGGAVDPVQDFGTASDVPNLLVSDGRTVMTSNFDDSKILRFDVASGKRLASLDHRNVIAGGFMRGGLFWAVS